MSKSKSESRRRHIIAMGGGGFSMDGARNTLLDDYVLRLTGKRRPRVCFVGTASGDSERYVRKFNRAFKGRAVTSHLALFNRSVRDLAGFLLAHDVIYVGGGNTANMLAVWRVHGVDAILRRAWRKGIVLCGVSAGALCWFECGVTDSYGPLAALDDGLGLLRGSMCPHYDGEAKRRPTYRGLVGGRRLPAGYAADDGAGLHFVGRTLAEVVTSRRRAGAYRLENVDGKAVETALSVRFLGT